MQANDSRGQETPARRTTCTDGGEPEQLTNEGLNDLLDGVTGEGTFQIHTEHASMGADSFDIGVEMDLAPDKIWLVADSDDPDGQYAMVLDADDAAYLSDVLARAAKAAEGRGDPQ